MPTAYCYFKGDFIPLEDAKISVMTHALHYGTGIFEGIRANWNEEQNAASIFRLNDHYERFLQGSKFLRMQLPYSAHDLSELTKTLVEKCGYAEDSYIRPLAYKSAERIGVLKLQDVEEEFVLFMIPFGAYLDVTAAARCCTSSWRRVEDTMIPPRIKNTGLYINSNLAKTDATLNGFDEAIMLTADGHVSEGTGENIFLYQKGKLVTPATSGSILEGITRNTVIQLAKDELGIETIERSVNRSELYMSDECFLTGTAAHLTPVGEIDNFKIGSGEMGSITKQLQALYFDVIRGKNSKYSDWCTLVPINK